LIGLFFYFARFGYREIGICNSRLATASASRIESKASRFRINLGEVREEVEEFRGIWDESSDSQQSEAVTTLIQTKMMSQVKFQPQESPTFVF
jgi:sigma54-dependent transcription regulator